MGRGAEQSLRDPRQVLTLGDPLDADVRRKCDRPVGFAGGHCKRHDHLDRQIILGQ